MLRTILASLALTGSLSADERTIPSVTIAPADLEKPAGGGDIDPEVMQTGKQQFLVCGACHGQSGEGTAAGPPLAGSEWVTGPEKNLIRIQLRGLKGPIEVKGVEYHFPSGMTAMAYQTDDQIAAVLTYIRNSFGNSAPPVAAAAVAALRGEVGKPQLTAAELIPPTTTPPSEPASPASGKYDQLSPASSRPKWILAALLIGLLAFLTRTFFRK